MKVVRNVCFGGFGLSFAAVKLYGEKAGLNLTWSPWSSDANKYKFRPMTEPPIDGLITYQKDGEFFYPDDIERTDPILIEVVEELGSEEASGPYAELEIVEIPDGVEWKIDDYDGIETIDEAHNSW